MVSDPNAGRGAASADLELKGHTAISDMLKSDMHQSLLPNCAHTVGPLDVKVSDGHANVLGFSRVYYKKDGLPKLMRLAFNHWAMVKTEKGWKIARRESRVMGEDAAQHMLRRALS